MLIDGSRLVLGSVNLNRRSFAHDTEVALLFTDPNVIAAYNRMFETDILPWLKPLTLDQLPPKSLMESIVKPWMGEL
jgi:phosphatidylserine/phosphatidylglycerophosphate/cardiolipin synthase-like enzyme